MSRNDIDGELYRPLEHLMSGIEDRPFPTYAGLSYDDCLAKHLVPNTPFFLAASTTADWPSRHSWWTPGPHAEQRAGPSRPKLSALRAFAHHVVPVANTRVRSFSEFERDERRLGDVLDEWEAGRGAAFYVKDWHLIAELERDGKWAGDVYEPPDCLRDDWLNPPFRPRPGTGGRAAGSHSAAPSLADFRFVYLGPAGTFTPLHRDVYSSYSWSANVVGRKVWWLFPPGDEPRDGAGELRFDAREVDGHGGGIRVLQEEGEVIFVPSGWHHQVVNVDFCISINHNFFAAPTLPRICASMLAAQAAVAASIADVKPLIQRRLGWRLDAAGVAAWEREWVDEVQGLLERDAGWAWRGFWRTVQTNLAAPPAAGPPPLLRDQRVRSVVQAYMATREWAVLDNVRSTVEQVERLLGPEGRT